MNTPFLPVLFALTGTAVATTAFMIGDEAFQLDYEGLGQSETFDAFVAEDVSRIFAPLKSISNVVDVTTLRQQPDNPVGLRFREWYPEGFSAGWVVTNKSGAILFQMKDTLRNRYAEAYEGFGTISNIFEELGTLVRCINDGTITNLPDGQVTSLIFVPNGTMVDATASEARTFFGDMSNSGPFTVSVLDCWTETIQGTPSQMAAAKTAVQDEQEVRFVPVVWIFRNGQWKYCHPALLDNGMQ